MNSLAFPALPEKRTTIELTFDLLDLMNPFNVVLNSHGMIIHVGPTLLKFESGRPFMGQNVFEVFSFQRPHNIKHFSDLFLAVGKKLKVHLTNGVVTGLRGGVIPLPKDEGIIINFGLGMKLPSLVQEFSLAAKDFAPQEGVGDMLYLHEMQTLLLSESVQLIERLQGARRSADEAAGRDPLTGVYNRRGLQGYLRRLGNRGEQKSYAFVQVDLDYFKIVNDTHGHAIGDMVLKRVAEIMINATRADDVVARTGGDEFVLVLSHVATEERLRKVCERLIENISSPMRLLDVTCGVGASIGAVLFEPEYGVDQHHLMQVTDQVLYQSKEKGRGQVSIEPYDVDKGD